MTVNTSNNDIYSGTSFHIGNRLILTVRYVIENNRINEILSHHYASSELSIRNIFMPLDPKVDFAALQTDFSREHDIGKVAILRGPRGTPAPKTDYIHFGDHLDD